MEKQRGMLDYGLWNGRVQALYDLGDEGPAALPLLIYLQVKNRAGECLGLGIIFQDLTFVKKRA